MTKTVKLFLTLVAILLIVPFAMNAQNAKNNRKAEFKTAKSMYKKGGQDEMIKGMKIMVDIKGEKSLKYVYKALKNDDRTVRRQALDLLVPYANQDMCDRVVKKYAKGDAVADVAKWLGDVKDTTHIAYLIDLVNDPSSDKETVGESVLSLGKMTNPDVLQCLVPLIGSPYQADVKTAFVSYNGDIQPYLTETIKGNDAQKLGTLDILQSRYCPMLHFEVRHLLSYYNNSDVRDAAYKALKNVVTIGDASFLKEHLECCDECYVTDVQDALIMAMRNATPAIKDEMVGGMQKTSPYVVPRFYRVFASFRTEAGVRQLVEWYNAGIEQEKAMEVIQTISTKKYGHILKDLEK